MNHEAIKKVAILGSGPAGPGGRTMTERPGSAPIMPWRTVTGPGQIRPGDWICFYLKGQLIRAPAQVVLYQGSEREEVIYNRKRNHYFITSMAVDGTSSHKNVQVVQIDPQQVKGVP